MAQIAEDLFLLLLDNAAAQPALERERRQRVLAAGALLDLAHACRIRPAGPGDAVEAGRLIALRAGGPTDPVVEPAFQLLEKRRLVAVPRGGQGEQERAGGRRPAPGTTGADQAGPGFVEALSPGVRLAADAA